MIHVEKEQPDKLFGHRISNAQKYANDAKWGKDYMDYIVPPFRNDTTWGIRVSEMDANYKLYHNQLNTKDFEEICNPMGVDSSQFGENVKPFNEATSKINILLGDELERQNEYRSIIVNKKDLLEKDFELQEVYKKAVSSEINELIEEILSKEGELSEEDAANLERYVAEKMTPRDIDDKKFRSSKEMIANHIIQFGMWDQRIVEKRNDGFKHALISGEEIVWTGIRNGKPAVEIINPMQAFYHKGPEVKYIQDGDYAGVRTIMTRFEALTNYQERMDEEQIDSITRSWSGQVGRSLHKDIYVGRDATRTAQELRNGHIDSRLFNEVGSYYTDENAQNWSRHDYVEVVHAEWKTHRKTGFLTYEDEFGELHMTVVDESYPIADDAVKVKFSNIFGNASTKYEWEQDGAYRCIEWLLIPRVWEGTRIDGDIYLDVREIPIQRFDINDPYKSTKLRYHGVVYSGTNARPISTFGRMKPFQFLFFIVMHQLMRLVVANDGSQLGLDIDQLANFAEGDDNSIHENLEWFLHYKKKGLAIRQSSANLVGTGQGNTRGNAFDNIQNSNAQDIQQLQALAEWLSMKIGEAAGVSPEREAKMTRGTNVTDNQQSIIQSMNITEPLFFMHEALWKEVMESYMHIFKSWLSVVEEAHPDKEEHIFNYVLPNGSQETFHIERAMLEDSTFGIFVENSGYTQKYRQMMEQYMPMLIQNQMYGADMVSEILMSKQRGSSVEEINEMIKEASRKADELQQQAQQAQQQALEQEMRDKMAEREFEIEKIKLQGDIDKEIAAIKIHMMREDMDKDNDGINDALEAAKLQHQINKDQRAADQADRKLDIEEKKAKQKSSMQK